MSVQEPPLAEAATRERTPSFICELPLRVTPAQERILQARLEAARQFYNACLFEAKRRVGLIRQSGDALLQAAAPPGHRHRGFRYWTFLHRHRGRAGSPLAALLSGGRPDTRALLRLDRQLDRQRRANNPDHYDERGRVKPRKKPWKVSKRQRKTLASRREVHRKLAATRKRSHGQLAHRVVALGDAFHLEHLSYRAWQKRYGRSVGLCAPGGCLSPPSAVWLRVLAAGSWS